ncbi:MAG: transcriptional repressor LexA [Candidatus Eremiobacteraeota bacterium]|nr:transcriptional repressor LexA [Candidatus Eremiobacteraeota bacterium]
MPESVPTERQERILEAIRDFTEEHGYPPSVREIGERVGLSSSSTVQSHLKSLEKRGLIHRDPTKPRALIAKGSAAAPKPAVSADAAVLPIVGRVAAGTPITATENVEGEFVLPAEFARKAGSFMLRVVGESMIDAAILDGDLIVVAPQPDAANGEIVVAMVDGEATVKRFYRESGRVRLQPENRTMEPIYSDDVTILGKVGAVIRKL